jgi:hypothetical protein
MLVTCITRTLPGTRGIIKYIKILQIKTTAKKTVYGMYIRGLYIGKYPPAHWGGKKYLQMSLRGKT